MRWGSGSRSVPIKSKFFGYCPKWGRKSPSVLSRRGVVALMIFALLPSVGIAAPIFKLSKEVGLEDWSFGIWNCEKNASTFTDLDCDTSFVSPVEWIIKKRKLIFCAKLYHEVQNSTFCFFDFIDFRSSYGPVTPIGNRRFSGENDVSKISLAANDLEPFYFIEETAADNEWIKRNLGFHCGTTAGVCKLKINSNIRAVLIESQITNKLNIGETNPWAFSGGQNSRLLQGGCCRIFCGSRGLFHRVVGTIQNQVLYEDEGSGHNYENERYPLKRSISGILVTFLFACGICFARQCVSESRHRLRYALVYLGLAWVSLFVWSYFFFAGVLDWHLGGVLDVL